MPRDADGVVTLAGSIGAKEGDPTGTPSVETKTRTDLEHAYNLARPLHDEIKGLEARLQALRLQRDKILGVAKGQNVETEGTALNLLVQVRDQLLIKNRGLEENLTLWGFSVVIGTAKAPTRQSKAQS